MLLFYGLLLDICDLFRALLFLCFYFFYFRSFFRYSSESYMCYLNIPWCKMYYRYFYFNFFTDFYSYLYFSVSCDWVKKLVFGPLKLIFITHNLLRAEAWLSTWRTSDANFYGLILILSFTISRAIQNY